MAFEADNSFNSGLGAPEVRFATPEEIAAIYTQTETLYERAQDRSFRKLFDGMKVGFDKRLGLALYQHGDESEFYTITLCDRPDGSMSAHEKKEEHFQDRTRISLVHMVIRDSQALASQEVVMALGKRGGSRNNYVPDDLDGAKFYEGKVPSSYIGVMQEEIDRIWGRVDISSLER